METPQEKNLHDKILSIPLVSVMVIAFLVTSGLVALVIDIYGKLVEHEKAKADTKVSELNAKISEAKALNAQELAKLVSDLERQKINLLFKQKDFETCQRTIKANEATIKTLRDSSSMSNDENKRCQSYEAEINRLNSEIDELKLKQIKQNDLLFTEEVLLVRNIPQMAIGEVNLLLKNVTDKKKNIEFEYTINNINYSEKDVVPNTLIGRRIGSYIYLFEFIKSSSDSPESAMVVVIKMLINRK